MANANPIQTDSAQPDLHHKRWSRFVVPALLIVIAVIVFATQSGGVGFWKGSHGWNSAHGLAIMTHASPQNLFVGYALADHSADGHTGYIYFDRYPFFFSTFIHTVMSLSDDLSTRVWLVRQVMNAIFAATLGLAFWLVRRLVHHTLLALAITLLAFSGYSLLYYRDMIHFDQPALLGMMLLLNAIASTKLNNRHRWPGLYLAALIAVSLGRGYASFFILGLSFVAEAGGLLLRRDMPFPQRIRQIFAHDVTRVLVLALCWSVVLLSYNIVVEALRRGVPIEQTSVVESALRRLPIGYDGDGHNLTTMSEGVPPPWGEFVKLEAERLIRWFIPIKVESPAEGVIPPYVVPAGLLALAAVIVYGVRQPPKQRLLVFLTAASGLAWLGFMINLTATHEFTIMYGVGLALMIYTAALSGLKRYRFAPALLLTAGLGLFAAANVRVYLENVDEIRSYDVYTQDYNRILHQIEGSGRSIYHTFPNNCAIENSKCFVLGFYLGDHYITADLDSADYILTGSEYHTSKSFLMPGDTEGLRLVSHSLTPDNTVAHLFDFRAAEVRHIPDDVHTMFNFGSSFTLQHWELRDSIQVQRCQRVYLESWWQMAEQPQHNYSLLIALVNTDGQAVSSANSPLTTVPTKVWIPDAYFLDARSLQVPCDAPAGEYPLVMSIYNPDTVAAQGSLPVTLPDGSPFNDYVYLTTLHVND